MFEWRKFFINVSPLSHMMIGVLFAIVCLVLLGGGILAVEKFGGVGLADCIQILIMVFIALTMFFGVRAHNHDKNYQQSATNLTSAISLVEHAARILQPAGILTNDRVAWITCARLISRAEVIKSKITTETHLLIYNAQHDLWRHSFRDLLKPSGHEKSGAFFCGGDSTRSIGETVTDTLHPKNGRLWIPEQALNVVYKFITFPEIYNDPLEGSTRFTDEERERMGLMGFDGVKEYADFRNNFYALGNSIRSKEESRRGVNQSAAEINDCIQSASWKISQ